MIQDYHHFCCLIFRLHEVLMTLQQKQLDDLAEWLAKTEERIATQESLGSDLAQIREQVDEHKVRLLYKIM